jgi:hypothetical protein
MAITLTLDTDYGYTQYRYNGGNADAIDATGATWIVANTGSTTNLYPFLVDNGKTGIDIYGATIDGTVSMTAEWLSIYNNSAAFMVRDTLQADVYDLRISDAWDAIRVAGDSDGFEVSNVWVSDVRDDAFENDNPVSGSIDNSLFDGVFSGISLGHKNMSDATDELLEIDGVLMRMESYLFKGQMTHQSPFKMESKSPNLSITDTVIAIDNVNHIGQQRLQKAWDKTIESSGNVFLNLSDSPLPSSYPMPPAGWTVLQGQAARDYWDTARADWIANHDGTTESTGTTPEPSVSIDPAITADVVEPVAPVEPVEPVAQVEPVQPAAQVAPVEPAVGPADLGIGVTILPSGKIELDGAILTSLQEGELLKENFEVAARADDFNDYIMYKWKTGELFYDQDGRGDASQVKIAQLDSRLKLDHTDFVVVGDTATTSAPPENSTTSTAGADVFTFDSLPTDGNFDTINGFVPGIDEFVFDSSVFTALQGQEGDMLDVSHFEVAARADDINDYVMYKWKTGELFYDPDGRGSDSQIKIAQLDTRMSLDHSDFMII